MDRQLILEKLESLRRYVRRIEGKCPDQQETLFEDWDVQDILTLNLTGAVQLCAHLIASSDLPAPNTMAGTFETMHRAGMPSPALTDRLRRAVGFRK